MSRNPFDFEANVRRTAEAVWGLEPGACQPSWYTSDPLLHELDGLAELRDITHVIMATTSTRLEKVKSDVAKLEAAAQFERKRRGNPVEKWLITEVQLQAEHVQHAKKNQVKLLTLENFRSRFFDGREYIARRRKSVFGSARNLVDGSVSVPDDEYIALPMIVHSGGDAADSQQSSVQDVAARVARGERIVIVAPFGAGKSLTLRQIFFELAAMALRGGGPVPLAINLREHWGAQYADEILERHARSIGFSRREDLVVAWRAGVACLLIDGFDEVAAQGVGNPTDRNWMRQGRYEALSAARELIANQPSGTGAVICGRDHYFDSTSELDRALGLVGKSYALVRLDEFTEDQAQQFLSRHAGDLPLPDWLPRKPLILGYLAHRGLLDSALRIKETEGFGFVWNEFLDLICRREADLDRAVMDPDAVRRVLERLATTVRSSASGAGALTTVEIADAYRAEAGEQPTEGVLMQLQRLPGLTPRDQDPSSRSFVDEDLLAALQGSAVARAVWENRAEYVSRRLLNGLSKNGTVTASHLLDVHGLEPATVLATARRFAERGVETGGEMQLAADAFGAAVELAADAGGVEGYGLHLLGVDIPDLSLDDSVVNNVTIVDSTIGLLSAGPALSESSIRIEGSHIGRVTGAAGEEGLPPRNFIGCSFGEFDDASSNAAILKLDMPLPMKALLTVLRKLYMQSGSGRRSAALKRGLPEGAIVAFVDPVVEILVSEGMVYLGRNDIVHPVRKQSGRARTILARATLSEDSIVRRVQALGG